MSANARRVFAMFAAILCLLGAAITVGAQQPERPIYSVETPEKKVALGINSAWGNEDIEQILAVLAQRGVSASFFVVGQWADKFPQSVAAIHAAGHEVGSHSDTHADMTKLSREGVLREIRESSRKIQAITGSAPTLLRPPSGAWNAQVVKLIEQEGLYPIQWDADSLDYRGLTAGQMQERIAKKLRPGSILLFHSGTKNTAGALGQIIDDIHAKGYEFVTVSQLVHPRPYTVDFEGRQRQLTVDN